MQTNNRPQALESIIRMVAKANNEDEEEVKDRLRKIAEDGNITRIIIGDQGPCQITPPRIDLLEIVADHAKKFGFTRRKYDPLAGEFDLFHLKRGVKISKATDVIRVLTRQNRTYRHHSSYKADNICDPEGQLKSGIRYTIEDLVGDKIQRDDLVQNMIAMEVRELLFNSPIRCAINKARRDDESAKLSFKGTTKCLLDESVKFVLTSGDHRGTFNIFISVTEGITVDSQLSQTYKIEITPENPLFTPENIAAWVQRCAEADLRRAIILNELKNTTKALKSELKRFVID